MSIPDTTLVTSAIGYARDKCEPYLFNHVVRSWLFATRLGQIEGIEHDAEVVAVGTLLHDITLNERFAALAASTWKGRTSRGPSRLRAVSMVAACN
ncbi:MULTISPECIES: hypothetical protein [unclassified Rhizobium]|uniref:hypothetical protein n=1 Tax=unclassified Rhizobium TaxID=2613769 RepID=UPI001FDA71AA|nr:MULTISPECIES: hypothetical protein [unclassified Rhizobium]